MKNYVVSSLRRLRWLLLAAAIASGPAWAEREDLFGRLEALDGYRFKGSMTFPHEPEHEMNQPMWIAIRSVTDDTLKISLQVGKDHSRTWILTRRSDGILLKHDHRQADGTPDKITNYGGLARPLELSTLLVFPADKETAQMLPSASTNVWSMRMSPDGLRFYYYLERNACPRFEATFDLSHPYPHVVGAPSGDS